jgi:NTP pyrophosphatase (non-canonical NTP hydrolase)
MFLEIFKLSRQNNKPLFVRSTKIVEELGEFSEALMHKAGFLPHKTMKEPIEGEAADVIITVLDTLAAAYPELTEQQVSSLLQTQLELKTHKWENLIKNS